MPSWRNGSASPSYGGRWGLRVRPPSTVRYVTMFLFHCHSVPFVACCAHDLKGKKVHPDEGRGWTVLNPLSHGL